MAGEASLANPQPQVDYADRQQHAEEHNFPLGSGNFLVLQGAQTLIVHTLLQRDQEQAGKQSCSREAHGPPIGKKYEVQTGRDFAAFWSGGDYLWVRSG